MPRYEEIKKAVKKYVAAFNKNGIIAMNPEKIMDMIDKGGTMNNQTVADVKLHSHNFVSDVMEYVTELMDESMRKKGTPSFPDIPGKVEDFVGNSLRTIMYNTVDHEKADASLTYIPGGNDGRGSVFTRFCNDVLGKTSYRLADAAIMQINEQIMERDDEPLALTQLCANLSTLIKDEKEFFVDKKNNGFEPNNNSFNKFVRDISVSYNAVHELYNRKSFFGKWLTPSGWMLRSAMNSTKEVVKAYYDDLSRENKMKKLTFDDVYNTSDYKKDIIAPGVDDTQIEKVSAILKGFSENSRVQITIEDGGGVGFDASDTDFHVDRDRELISLTEIAEDEGHRPDDDVSEFSDDEVNRDSDASYLD